MNRKEYLRKLNFPRPIGERARVRGSRLLTDVNPLTPALSLRGRENLVLKKKT